MSKDKIKHGNSGYTLIEMMIVISVIAVLTVSSFIIFSGTKNNNELYSEAKKIVSNLKYMKLLAVNEGKTCQMVFNSEGTGYIVRFRDDADVLRFLDFDYGITFDSGKSAGLKVDGTSKYFEFLAFKGVSDSSEDIEIVLSNGIAAYISIIISSGGTIDIK
ncbi:pilus assembly FimT family protein [Pseudobacteroides cellulosolvens]|uniref:pilus assembly FimT family protein n=1 Tax=Pseudobacteroides cellulosolvens TaxID=35825 RepID=UPI0005678E0B|nr:prepilin-type N-terminal cleavage/methylation domain-containing protein [Pseudobacteroides cellulosolvens]